MVLSIKYLERKDKTFPLRILFFKLLNSQIKMKVLYIYANCQAKVKTKSKVKSKLQRSKDQKLLWTFVYSIVISPPHPTLNFSNTSRGPTPKCYTFLETSHDPRLRSKLRCKNFANFFATLLCNQT